jgi:alpha-tubulin suppressor-like RCC1 family protein
MKYGFLTGGSRNLGLVFILIISSFIQAQIDLQGTILDRVSGKPIGGAQVVLIGGNIKTTSDSLGIFRITKPGNSLNWNHLPEGKRFTFISGTDLVFRNSSPGLVKISFTDINGRSFSKSQHLQLQEGTWKLNCGDLRPGFYFGFIKTKNQMETFHMVSLQGHSDHLTRPPVLFVQDRQYGNQKVAAFVQAIDSIKISKEGYFATSFGVESMVAKGLVAKLSDTSNGLAKLIDITLSAGPISPSFKLGTLTYSLYVGSGISSTTVKLTAYDAKSIVKVNGAILSSGATSDSITLPLASNAISVEVSATDGSSKTYTIFASRLSGSFLKVSTGLSYTVVLKTDGTLWANGFNEYGQLGLGDTTYRLSPNQMMTGVAKVSAGSNYTMVLKTDGTLWATGIKGAFNFGSGSPIFQSTPAQFVMDSVLKIDAGFGHALFLKKDGSLWASGDNRDGQLGDGTTTNRLTPVLTMIGVADMAAGGLFTLLLKTDGNLWGLGSNRSGELGDGGISTQRIIPYLMMSGVEKIAAGYQHSLILKTDGTLWATGNNNWGQLGDGTNTKHYTPFQMMAGVANMAVGQYNSLILKTDGTLWGTGMNNYGQLGDGTTTSRFTPVPIMTGVANMDAGEYHTLILKVDGTLWATGGNGFGQLGDGTSTDRLTPVKISF